MQAKIDFDNSIQEVIYLNDIALSDTDHDKIYFKSIILLLSAKLEKFIKDSSKEYIDELLKLNLTKDNLPDKFLFQVLKNELNRINNMQLEKYISNERNRSRAKVLSLIWDSKFILKDLEKDEFAISLSNNGTTAFEEIYSKIGFPNIINDIDDYVQSEDVTTTTISVKDQINKIVRIRNTIIHDDATPTLPKKDIDLFVEVSKWFVCQIDEALSSHFKEIKSAKS